LRHDGSGTDDEALALLLDLGLGQQIEIGNDLGPGPGWAERGDAVFQRRFIAFRFFALLAPSGGRT
jgi:hypothetical protein